jgi:hypothetical protein
VFTKYLAPIGALVVLVVVICFAAQVRQNQLDRGGEWLSWSPAERATFVDGFIAGYRQGSHGACEVAQELFGEPGKMYQLGDENRPSEMPSARCLARMEDYSKAKFTETSGPDFSAYADVITDFYAKHPEYRGVPFVNLLKLLSDRTYKTADQLYQMALKGELHSSR